ncbi:MAG: hypothetical protein NTV06_07265, partial [candidate division Zixibacteria bacterium]|nr:hypothetical protein [candidate division Zixibacteria bacterium]
MLVIWYFVLIIVIDYIGYVFSLHLLTIHLTREKAEPMTDGLTRLSKRYLSEITANPRISIQMAVIIKSFIMIATSFLAVLSAQSLTKIYTVDATIIFLLSFLIIWSFYLFFMEYLPRRRSLGRLDRDILRLLPFFA